MHGEHMRKVFFSLASDELHELHSTLTPLPAAPSSRLAPPRVHKPLALACHVDITYPILLTVVATRLKERILLLLPDNRLFFVLRKATPAWMPLRQVRPLRRKLDPAEAIVLFDGRAQYCDAP
jgi:hypothetical protein